jgi:hypothetical protein
LTTSADGKAQLQRLADIGREAIRLGARGQDDDSEDLDLLSARKTFRRSDRETDEAAMSHRAPDAGRDPEQMLASGTGHMGDSDHFRPEYRSVHLGDASTPLSRQHAHNSHAPLQMPLAEMLSVPSWTHVGHSGNSGLDLETGNLGDFDVNAVSTRDLSAHI